MSLNSDFILKGLLQHNYFPTQKEDREELPPILNSKLFTPEIAILLQNCSIRRGGYDQVEYRATRHTNVSRALSIPHPLAHAKLSHSLSENWNEIRYISESEVSLIVPREHEDGRIIIMNYESSHEKIERHIRLSFNRKFVVKTDISGFFPSVYSHAIPWALVGFDVAKNDRDRSRWFNQIDYYQRMMKREETSGVPIGPASSNIVSEAILARIDEKLCEAGFVFVRFIDDYTGYCNTYEEAEKFIRILGDELSAYKLHLNIKKTDIDQLPEPTTPEWIVDLTTRFPDKDNLSVISVIRYLDYAVTKQYASPDGSVLKYAAKSIIHSVEGENAEIMLKYLLGLSTKYAILLPLLDILFNKMNFRAGFPYRGQLVNILCEHSIHKRSDAMAWVLYYLNKFSQPIPQEAANCVIGSRDCISILILYVSRQYDEMVKEFVETLDDTDLFQLDQYWLLLYQLFFDDIIPNPYQNVDAYGNHLAGNRDTTQNAMQREIQAFNILKENGVTFVEMIQDDET